MLDLLALTSPIVITILIRFMATRIGLFDSGLLWALQHMPA
jgi:hypothetical protein